MAGAAASSPKLMFSELNGSLKSVVVGIFTLWKWASTKKMRTFVTVVTSESLTARPWELSSREEKIIVFVL